MKVRSIKKIALGIMIALVALEVLLRLTGAFKVYSERIGQGYSSYWGYKSNLHYKIMPINYHMRYVQKEFTIEFMTNSLGMRNKEIDPDKPDSVYRIICMGDSFTEGDGAPWGFSYPRQLEKILNLNAPPGRSFEVINAGKNGSDVIYAEKIFTDILWRLDPDLVLVAVNDSDIDDVIQRGGHERFRSDGTTVFRDGPWYEGLYARSLAFRFIIHVPLLKNRLFLGPLKVKKETRQASEIIAGSMSSLQEFCNSRSIPIRFIIHPIPSQLDPKVNRHIKLAARDAEKYFRKSSRLSGLPSESPDIAYDLFLSLTDSLARQPLESYSWPLNGHFNPYGYGVFAGEVYRQMSTDALLREAMMLQ